jgi:hypothetical protein
MLLAVSPLSLNRTFIYLVFFVVGPSHSPFTLPLIVHKLSNILLAIRPNHCAATIDSIVLPLSLIDLPIKPMVSPVSFDDVVPKLANICSFLWPSEFALSVLLASYVITALLC